MTSASDIFLINKFPDFNAGGFNISNYNQRFKRSNILINAWSADISYPEHWGCLSVKCAFGGNETYIVGDRYYRVNDDTFFICNEGEYYSSFIAAKKAVESFTLNFSHDFVNLVAQASYRSPGFLLDNPDFLNDRPNEFIQKLYRHSGTLSGIIFNLGKLARNFDENKGLITEEYHLLLEKLFLSQQEVGKEIKKINAIKPSTQLELYKRLHYAKDYIDSCFKEDITLARLALVSCLNSAYLLREFKQYFKQTPHQYLIQKRMAAAKDLLLQTSLPVTGICFEVGYADASSFCKLFKKHYLYPPESYRAKKVIFHTFGTAGCS